MAQNNDIREILIDEIKKDIVGPRGDEDEEYWGYERPQTRYFSGVLYPRKTPFKSDDQLKNTNAGTTDDEEGEDESSFTIAVGTKPSSLGMSCQISEKTKSIDAEINFAKYDPVTRPKKKKKSETKTEDLDIESGWKRRTVSVNLSVKTDDTKDIIHDIDDESAKILIQIKPVTDKKRSIVIFLLNTHKVKPEDEFTEDNECIFQPSIKLKTPKGEENVFLAISDKLHAFYKELQNEEKRFELLFRNKKQFAIGRNCSVTWSKKEVPTNYVEYVETTLLPHYEVQDIKPREDESLKLETLKNVDNFSEYEKLLTPMKNKYKDWIDKLSNNKASIPDRFIDDGTVEFQINHCEEVLERIETGIKEVSKDNSIVGEAFRFANSVMYNQMRYSDWAKENQINGGKIPKEEKPIGGREPTWYIFQLAFILLNIESIINPKSENRETVDLLWFPTGGGKTEAYFGLIAFNLALRRLRETGWNKYGVTVIMRYTYRILTLQQFQRASALMCACEYERRKNKEKWGDEPFSVGLFVGDKTTPNDLKTAKKNLYDYQNTGVKPEEGNPVQIISCPWCGTTLGPWEYGVYNLPKRMRIRCKNPKCYFGNKDNKDSFLPVIFIDEDINSSLPSLLISTVDKFARISWKSEYAAIFGKVTQYCRQHGFQQSNKPMKNLCPQHRNKEWKTKMIKPVPSPELIIQDELHLISGPLGTLVGLYETAVGELCNHNNIKPKIIASTATVKNSDNQIKWLFARDKSKIFPPQAFDFGETYFSKIIPFEEKSGKIHLGVCATSVGGYIVDARIAAAVLRKIRYLVENKDKFGFTAKDLDPYYTLVSYYNTIKNIGAAKNMYDDSVPNFMGTIRKKFEENSSKELEHILEKEELTGRIDAGKIPAVLSALEVPLIDEFCKCDDSIREKQDKEICNVCKKSTSRPLDSLLCTNVLSVGVDVSRLSLMLINGMPKHISEYIQASGRIGRSRNYPGLVITNYTYLRARDLSYFEDFINFHSKYHNWVEPGTLTPFAARARDRGLFGVLVALVRNKADEDNGCRRIAKVPYRFKQDDQLLTALLEQIRKKIRDRVNTVDKNEMEDTEKDLEDCIEKWYSLAENDEKLKYKRNYHEFASNSEHDVFLLKRIGDVDPPGKEGQFVPDSLRQAEGNIPVYYQPTSQNYDVEEKTKAVMKDDEDSEERHQISPGDMRPSQLIQGFGPGSILSMEHDAVMILGCQVWPKKDLENKRYEILNHPHLSKVLNVTHLRMPFSRGGARVIPAISFPQWGVCKKCKILQKHDRTPPKKTGFSCYHCNKKGDYGKLIHARLVVICERGHIDEFPWEKWLHRNSPDKKCPKSKSPMMKFYAQEKSSSLGDYAIKCLNCPAWTTLTGSTDKKKFDEMPRCSGRSPWLSDHIEKGGCIDPKIKQPSMVRGIQIRAPSLYYPITISAIKIPQWTHPVFDRLLDVNDEGNFATLIRESRKNNLGYSQIIDTFRTYFQEIKNILKEQKKNDGIEISDEGIKKEIIEKLEQYFTDTVDDDIPDQIEILNQEFDNIQSIQNTKGKRYESEFQLQTSDITGEDNLEKYLSSLKQISRITTISALYGFTRSEPPDPLSPNNDKMQKITTSTHKHQQKWLPGVQNVGEGIFFSLNPDKLEKWEILDDVKKRCNTIIESFAAFAQPRDEKRRKETQELYNERFILLHTLSHLIIKSMAKYAGYNEASLKERIYWDNDKINGILIYASSGTSEGSLGGLVRLGQSEKFARILNDSIRKSRSCSRDPICGETNPVDDKKRGLGRSVKLTGSTCHSCCFVPETSCAFFNQLLDRWTVSESGFFSDFE